MTFDLDELDKLCEAATDGPWEFDAWGNITAHGEGVCRVEWRRGDQNEPLIAAARTAIPELVAEVRRLQEAEKKVDDAWQDGYDHGYYDGDLNASSGG